MTYTVAQTAVGTRKAGTSLPGFRFPDQAHSRSSEVGASRRARSLNRQARRIATATTTRSVVRRRRRYSQPCASHSAAATCSGSEFTAADNHVVTGSVRGVSRYNAVTHQALPGAVRTAA